jgi:hypothetical protein
LEKRRREKTGEISRFPAGVMGGGFAGNMRPASGGLNMRRLVRLAALALGIAVNASAQAERLSDRDVNNLVEGASSAMGTIRAAIGRLNQAFGL